MIIFDHKRSFAWCVDTPVNHQTICPFLIDQVQKDRRLSCHLRKPLQLPQGSSTANLLLPLVSLTEELLMRANNMSPYHFNYSDIFF